MNKFFTLCLLALFCSSCSTRSACGPHLRHDDKCMAAAAEHQPLPQMSDEEMMSKIKQAGTPGPAHMLLQPLVGEWRTETRLWKEPGAAPDVSTGRSTRRWIFGNRFLAEDYTGTFFGQPFEGQGVMGYDNVLQKYTAVWIDSIGTGIMTSKGRYDPDTRSIDMTAKYSCPVTGGKRKSRAVTRIVNDNQNVFEMYDRGADGKEFKSMEMVYSRQK